MDFYGALFGWEFEVGPPETGHYTMCRLQGRRAVALMPNPDPNADAFWWNVYLATDDCDRTAERVRAAGGELLTEPMDVMGQGRMAMVRDPARRRSSGCGRVRRTSAVRSSTNPVR